ncbi:dethiobiotin synthase [Colwellia psychrerythraea]|uniref:ATP-dependent dethiobiotin synthetase BioD n=1 Tax=Colwellia psychrerythraea TaxID=28229 RepID=A0A099KUJ2_COLPS|nr:dethiobiotin synthase [Colwellia psychrerythraea]KGJ93865.1 Dethiobiotin synthetase [Colwellia psychrerythraea]
MKQFFITATDTDAGKTFVSCALIKALTNLQTKNFTLTINETSTPVTKVAAFKPISAGCELLNGQLINEDAKLLSEFSNCGQSIGEINPIAFAEPIAPHIAAKKLNRQISLGELNDHYHKVKSLNADFTLVEGAGGWRLPLGPALLDPKSTIICNNNNDNQKPTYQFLSDFVKSSDLTVILIVNMKLGCLNHALLTYEAIKSDGVNCIAWIANCASSDSMNNLAENIAELEQLLPMPKIAQFDFFNDRDEQGNEISFNEKISLAAEKINLTTLID